MFIHVPMTVDKYKLNNNRCTKSNSVLSKEVTIANTELFTQKDRISKCLRQNMMRPSEYVGPYTNIQCEVLVSSLQPV